MSEYFFSFPVIILINIIGLNLGLIIIGIAVWLGSEGKDRTIVMSILGFIFIVILYLTLISPMQAKIVLNEELEIDFPPYAHEIIKKEEIVNIDIVDLELNQNLQPTKKIIGGGMGDSRYGIYRLKNQKKAIMRTEGTKVACIELADKYIIVAPEIFDDFVSELDQKFYPVESRIERLMQ